MDTNTRPPVAGDTLHDGRTITHVAKTADTVTLVLDEGDSLVYARWDYDSGMLNGIVAR